MFYREFQPNFLGQRDLSNTNPPAVWSFHKAMAPAAQGFWEEQCMEKAALQMRDHLAKDDTKEKLHWR